MIRLNSDTPPSSTAVAPPVQTDRPAPAAPREHRRRVSDEIRQITHPTEPRNAGKKVKTKKLGLLARAAISFAVGIGVFAAGRFDYPTSASLRTNGPPADVRRELLDIAWHAQDAGALHQSWRVESDPAHNGLLMHLLTHDGQAARQQLQALVKALQDRLEQANTTAEVETTAAERIVSQIAGELRGQITDIEKNMGEATTENTPPISQNQAVTMRQNVSDLFAKLESLRQTELAAADRLNALAEDSVEPAFDFATRLAAYHERADLRQDLDELTLHLAESRSQLIGVWRTSSPRLDALAAATEKLSQSQSADQAAGAPESLQEVIVQIGRRAELYRRRLDTFVRRWSETFTRLRETTPDPFSIAEIDGQKRLHELAADFLHHGGKLIEQMRSDVRRLTENPDTAPRYFRVITALKKSFHEVESEHQQFEFVEGAMVFTRNNFRLDAALRSARRLAGRVRRACIEVDESIRADRREKARLERIAEQVTIDGEIRRVRTQTYATIDEIVHAVGQWDQHMLGANSTALAEARRDAMQQRLADAKSRLEGRERILEEITRTRVEKHAQRMTVECVACVSEPTPANLQPRAAAAFLSATLTFALMTFAGGRASRARWQ